eukprot:7109070-Prymnesium_polylepis.1
MLRSTGSNRSSSAAPCDARRRRPSMPLGERRGLATGARAQGGVPPRRGARRGLETRRARTAARATSPGLLARAERASLLTKLQPALEAMLGARPPSASTMCASGPASDGSPSSRFLSKEKQASATSRSLSAPTARAERALAPRRVSRAARRSECGRRAVPCGSGARQGQAERAAATSAGGVRHGIAGAAAHSSAAAAAGARAARAPAAPPCAVRAAATPGASATGHTSAGRRSSSRPSPWGAQ